MLPVTGPFRKTIGNSSGQSFRDERWYRQKKPYDLPLTYDLDRSSVSAFRGSYVPDAVTYHVPIDDLNVSRQVAWAQSKAWSKLIDQVHSTSQWAVTLLEGRQSMDLITFRLNQLARFTQALKQKKLGKAVEILITPTEPQFRRQTSRVNPDVTFLREKVKGKHFAAKSFSSQWLELHFGIVPLMEDIHNAMEFLSSAHFGERQVKGSSSREVGWVRGSLTAPYSQVTWYYGFARCRYGGTVRITNPNAALASSLGLINPVSVAAELVPWSFVLDWFSNASQFLNAWSEFVGMEITNAYSTRSTRLGWNYRWNTYGFTGMGTSSVVKRTPGFAPPGFTIKPSAFSKISAVRAATIMSLLILQLPSK